MPFITREAKHPDDAATMWRNWSWVFRHKAPEEPFDEPESGEKWYVAEDDGQPVSVCAVNAYTIHRGDIKLKCGGVAAVATPPEHRKKGYGTRFMVDVIRMMRQEGHVVSSLYAFRDPYYAKVGYATCGWRWKIVCPAERLPKIKSDLPISQIDPKEIEKFEDVYEHFARQLSGSVVRTSEDWKSRLGKVAPMLFAIGDPIEAYAWVKLSDFWGNVDVGECAWKTKKGYEAILSLFNSLAHNQKTVTWCEPPQSPFLVNHIDRGVEMMMFRQTMHRVLDVQKAIESLAPITNGEFTIEITDNVIEDNNGAWQVWFESNKAQATKCKSGDIKMDIGSFSQAFMGSPNITELAQHGLIDVRSKEALKAAEKLFDPIQVCCMDFF